MSKWLDPQLCGELEPLQAPEELLEGAQDRLVQGLDLSGLDLSDLRWERSRFQRCRFSGAVLTGTECVDVVFEDCDLSNCLWSRAYLCRCLFRNEKGVGLDWTGAGLHYVTLEDSLFRYGNLSGGRLNKVRLIRCDLSEAAVSQAALKETSFQECVLRKTSFFKTSLSGQDFSTSTVEGLVISDTAEELKGLTVRYDQAAELAKLLGLRVVG
ncbi:MAG: pentapeptide repeat-containing protein [Oscillospiraceae bacterium]|nr:pentapeptide repeat-containing protein [Oscillospiraceae bacterium]